MEQITFEQLPTAVSKLFDKLTRIENILSQKQDQPNLASEQVLTIKQAASFLSLSVPTLYGLVSRQAIPVNKRGKRLYFSQTELTEWVKAGRKLTVSEIESQADNYLLKKKGVTL